MENFIFKICKLDIYIYLYEPSFDSEIKIININKFHQLTSTLSLLVFPHKNKFKFNLNSRYLLNFGKTGVGWSGRSVRVNDCARNSVDSELI